MHSKVAATILIVALAGWRIYVRVHRSIGRQRIKRRRLSIRITILAIIGVLFALTASRDFATLGAVLAGGACGAALALLGLRYTQFEITAEGSFYKPHTYLGLAVTVLFLGRLAYDFTVFWHGLPGPTTSGEPPTALVQYSPLTVSISGLFIAYYLGYYVGVLRKSRRIIGSSGAIFPDPQ